MKKFIIPICGAAILGLAALSTGASAASLSNVGGAMVNPSAAIQAPVEDVAWRRVCRPTTIWRNGRRIVVQRCTNVRVRNGPGYGRPGYPPAGRPGYPAAGRPGYGYQGGAGGPAPGPGWGR